MLILEKNIIQIIMLKTVVLINIFGETMIHYYLKVWGYKIYKLKFINACLLTKIMSVKTFIMLQKMYITIKCRVKVIAH